MGEVDRTGLSRPSRKSIEDGTRQSFKLMGEGTVGRNYDGDLGAPSSNPSQNTQKHGVLQCSPPGGLSFLQKQL